jgi:hypothetical protein
MPVAEVELDAAALDFLIDYLPEEDDFTQELVKLRERAKDYLWGKQ